MTLDELNTQLRQQKFTAGWNKTTPSLWKEPRTPYAPRHWSFRVAKEGLDRAGGLISTDLAERRNLLMFDDADKNQYATTQTLVVAYQMLKPGEHARAHRHSPNALRLMLEAPDGVFTNVDGIELPMSEGSVLFTPGRAWHSHFSNASANAYWIDFLDVPLVHQLEPMFFEHHPDDFQPTTSRQHKHDFVVSRKEIAERLAAVSPNASGARVADISCPEIPTMQTSVIAFDTDDAELGFQEAANSIFAVINGNGEIKSGSLQSDWEFGDVFSVPMWNVTSIRARKGSIVLRVSDKPVMEKLGFFKQTQR
jgi:gentisate 1,2-dioxygenase